MFYRRNKSLFSLVLLVSAFAAIYNICSLFNVIAPNDTFAHTASITTNDVINLDVSHAGNGANTVKDDIVIDSTCPLGYTLSIQGPSDSTLYKDGNKANYNTATTKISASAGTIEHPASLIDNKNTWGYTTSPNNLNDLAKSTNFIGLTGTEATLFTSSSASADSGDKVSIYYGASVDATIEPGQYKLAESSEGAGDNRITYILTTSPACNVGCPAGHICYDGNENTSEFGMGDQEASSNTETTLWASNYAKNGYGFAGWNTEADGTGTTYGPNQTLTAEQVGDLSSEGLQLYAKWVKAEDNVTMQTWSGCSSLSAGSVIALKDSRDNNVYTISKLTDGNCWMMENLRLGRTTSFSTNVFNSTSTDHPVSGFRLNASTNEWCNDGLDTECINQPLLYSDNTSNPVSTVSSENGGATGVADANIYSYGNYYNWYAATAGNGTASFNSSDNIVPGSICPAGWYLPLGGSNNSTEGSFYNLITTTYGELPDSPNNGYPVYSETNALNASKALRKYPNNFVYSGELFNNGPVTADNRSKGGYYWSASTADSSGGNDAPNPLVLIFSENTTFGDKETPGIVYPGNIFTNKYYGYTARCVSVVSDCPADSVCYDGNGDTGDTDMDNQTVARNSDVTLWPSNFKRDGYGFVGWNTKADGTGTTYGPNQTVTRAELGGLYRKGIKLYAKWVKAEDNVTMQTWDGCASMQSGSIIGLRDERDNNVYAVTKLADNKCWMIENLRLGGSENIELDSTNSDLTEGKTFTLKAAQDPIENAWCNANNADCIDQSLLATNNTSNTVSVMTTPALAEKNGTGIYSYGNYYNWYAATAGTMSYNDFSGDAPGSICPKGWHLPTGGSGNSSTGRELSDLDFAIGGTGSYDRSNSPISSKRWRSFPNNFVYSGEISRSGNDGRISSRNSSSNYWSATGYSQAMALALNVHQTSTYPGIYYSSVPSKYTGYAVRCVIDKVGKITYYDNGANSETKMREQNPGRGATTATLWPSNYKRDGYGFAGWNTKADGTGVSYGPNETITLPGNFFTNGLELYAMWVKAEDNVTMQTWDGCASMQSGSIIGLRDERDNNVYAVTKLADNKCWMIENLRLGGSENIELDSTNSDLTEGKTFTLKAAQDPIENAWCNANNADCIDQSLLATNNTSNTVSVMTTPALAEKNGTGIYSYGNYYNWYAATAGTMSYNDFSGDAPGSICPKGWHLPTGGSGNSSTGRELSDLDFAIGGTGSYDRSNSPISSKRWRSFPNNFVYSGEISRSGNDGRISSRNSSSNYWSATGYSQAMALALNVHQTSTYPGIYYSSVPSKYTGYAVRCVIDKVGKITYYDNGANSETKMREQNPGRGATTATLWPSNYKRDGYGFAGWNTKADGTGVSYGPNETITLPDNFFTNGLELYAMWVKAEDNVTMQTWDGCEAMQQDTIIALTDTRDNNVYTISKLADGKCWMLENLRLGGADSIELTPDDTDIFSNFTLSGSSDNWCSQETEGCINQSLMRADNTTSPVNHTINPNSNILSYGNYYNWYSATAGSGTLSVSGGDNATSSICPKGWRLPTSYGNSDFKALNDAANAGSSSTSNGLRAYPNNFVLSGETRVSNIYSRNGAGYYWSPKGKDAVRAYSLYITTSSTNSQYDGNYGYAKLYGYSIRCVIDGNNIYYHDNGATENVGRNKQILASGATTATLWPSNYKRDGYGFAGWNTKADGTGVSYGPNETITLPDNFFTNGLELYAMWVKAEDNVTMQTWDGCEAMQQDTIIALTDTRDNNVYTISKLADGKCWMLENLRLGGADSIELTPDDTDIFSNFTLSGSSDNWCSQNTEECINQSLIRADNTTSPVNHTINPNSNILSYGNYYNWYSATAGSGTYSVSGGDNATSSICPKGWRLPTGGSNGEMNTLISALGGTNDAERSSRLRSYPSNLVYSGITYSGNVVDYRGSGGYLWSATMRTDYTAYRFNYSSGSISSMSDYSTKSNGLSVRCVAKP